MQIWIVLTSLESLWQRPNFLPYEHGKTGGRDESRLSRVRILLIFNKIIFENYFNKKIIENNFQLFSIIDFQFSILIFKTVKNYRFCTQKWEILTIWETYTNYL